MANVWKGLNRIVWLVSIGCTMGMWMYLYSITEIRSGIPRLGLDLINKLDKNPARANSINWQMVLEEMPNLDVELFKLRYDLTPDSSLAVDKKEYAKRLRPEELFRREIQLNVLMLVFGIGLISFMGVWLIWFAIRWVILGFKS